MAKKCFITGAGSHYTGDDFTPSADDLVIAADGGYIFNSLQKIKTDILIGDFDSLGEQNTNYTGEVIKLNPVKDETDMLCAVNAGLEKGCSEFHIFGGTGGRNDHTFANIQVLNYLACKGKKGFLYAENEIMTVIHDSEINFNSEMAGYISVFSLDSECESVTEKGLKYTVNDYHMDNRFPIGVSNEFCGTDSSVSVRKGSLLIIYPRYNF
jgi:thiamine pyrophosphokinase